MQTEREVVVWTLRARGDHDRALVAECSLPPWVDLDEDAATLRQLDIDVTEIEPLVRRT